LRLKTLKIPWEKSRAGSNPAVRTKTCRLFGTAIWRADFSFDLFAS
jgi:hypothetical protein